MSSSASVAVCASANGAVIAIEVEVGQRVAVGQTLLILESMKMEIPVVANHHGVVRAVFVAMGEVVEEGVPVFELQRVEALVAAPPVASTSKVGPRATWLVWQARQALLADAARPHAVAARHAAGKCAAGENIAALLDAGSFAVAAQRTRRSEGDSQHNTPADGLITGTGTVGAENWGDSAQGDEASRVAVMAYDYTLPAGTQGYFNHRKSDRILDLAARLKLPVVLFAEGDGGRPGDVDALGVAGLDCGTFARLAALSGQVPLIGIVLGRCFAGNAALLGCCDVIIATEDASIGMGGPAMIEGGGLSRAVAIAASQPRHLGGALDAPACDKLARFMRPWPRAPGPVASLDPWALKAPCAWGFAKSWRPQHRVNERRFLRAWWQPPSSAARP